MCYHLTDLDTRLSKIKVVWRPLLAKLTGDLRRPSPGSLRFRANGSHQLTGADRQIEGPLVGSFGFAAFWFASGVIAKSGGSPTCISRKKSLKGD
jgi:hypothetical protein